MSIVIKNIKHKDKVISFPDLSFFEKSNDIFLTEKTFINYLENILYTVAKSNVTFSCLYDVQSILEHFIQLDLNEFSLKISKDLLNYINTCSNNVRLIIIPVKLILLNSLSTYKEYDFDIENLMKDDFNIETNDDEGNMYGGHSNLIIIDNVEKTIEFFEPHGEKFMHTISSIVSIDKLLEKIIKDLFIFTKQYTFINSASICIIGPQALQSKIDPKSGHCLAWSLLFILLRILNSNLTKVNISQFIYEFLITINSNLLDSIIRRFITFIKSLPQIDKPYDKYIEGSVIDIINKNDIEKMENRLKYLLNIFFQKQRNSSFKNIDIIYEEIVSYRHLENFHKIYTNIFKEYIVKNCNNIIEEEKLLSEFEF